MLSASLMFHLSPPKLKKESAKDRPFPALWSPSMSSHKAKIRNIDFSVQNLEDSASQVGQLTSCSRAACLSF